MWKLTEYLRGPGGPRGIIHVSSLSAHTTAVSLGETEPEKLCHWPQALPQNPYLDISDAQSFFFSRVLVWPVRVPSAVWWVPLKGFPMTPTPCSPPSVTSP